MEHSDITNKVSTFTKIQRFSQTLMLVVGNGVMWIVQYLIHQEIFPMISEADGWGAIAWFIYALFHLALFGFAQWITWRWVARAVILVEEKEKEEKENNKNVTQS